MRLRFIILITFLIFAKTSFSQLYGIYKSEAGKQAYTSICPNGLIVCENGFTGVYLFSGNNVNGAFYNNSVMGTVFMSYDTKTLVVNSTVTNTSNSYTFIKADYNTPNTGINNPQNQGDNSTTNQLKRRSCSSCDGTGYVVGSVAAYGSLQEKWCNNCNGWVSATHCCRCKVCPSCGGKGYTESY